MRNVRISSKFQGLMLWKAKKLDDELNYLLCRQRFKEFPSNKSKYRKVKLRVPQHLDVLPPPVDRREVNLLSTSPKIAMSPVECLTIPNTTLTHYSKNISQYIAYAYHVVHNRFDFSQQQVLEAYIETHLEKIRLALADTELEDIYRNNGLLMNKPTSKANTYFL